MSPARKRPTCHTCGSPMAGHKRPNGILVCPITVIHEVEPEPPKSTTNHGCNALDLSSPDPCSPAPSPAPSTSPPALRREQSIIIPNHWVNPNFVESPHAAASAFRRPAIDRAGTPNTWVSTEPADDIPVKREREVFETFDPTETVDDGLFPSGSTAGPSLYAHTHTNNASASASSSGGLRRTFTNLLRNSRPVASLFSTPRDEVDGIAEEARRNGLYTGLIHRPRPSPLEAVKEETSVPGALPRTPGARAGGGGGRGGGLDRASSWWLVLGHSAEAVGHLLDLQDRGTRAKFATDATLSPLSSPGAIGAGMGTGLESPPYPPLDKLSVRNSYMDLIIASCIGAFLMFYLLAL